MAVLRLSLFAAALVVAQSFATSLLPQAMRPDLPLVFALAMGLRGAGASRLVLAFGIGFAVDVLSGAPLGMFALLRGTACAATRLFDRALFLREAAPWGLYVAGYALLDAILLALAMRVFAPEAALPLAQLLLTVPGIAIGSGAIAGLLLGVFRRLDAEPASEPSGLGMIGSRVRP